jgi:hypothetical protein
MRKQSSTLKHFALVVAVATTFSSTALAASSSVTTVNIVEYGQYSGYAQLLVQLTGGVNYYANPGQASPGCGVVMASVETAKVWASLAQSALLSGRNVRIYYTYCGGYNWIYALDLGP